MMRITRHRRMWHRGATGGLDGFDGIGWISGCGEVQSTYSANNKADYDGKNDTRNHTSVLFTLTTSYEEALSSLREIVCICSFSFNKPQPRCVWVWAVGCGCNDTVALAPAPLRPWLLSAESRDKRGFVTEVVQQMSLQLSPDPCWAPPSLRC